MSKCQRRDFLATSAAAIASIGIGSSAFGKGGEMYGLIGRMNAVPGTREQLIAILLEASANMPGCLSYVVAEDARDANAMTPRCRCRPSGPRLRRGGRLSPPSATASSRRRPEDNSGIG